MSEESSNLINDSIRSKEMIDSQPNQPADAKDVNDDTTNKKDANQRPRRSGVQVSAAVLLGRIGSLNLKKDKVIGTKNKVKSPEKPKMNLSKSTSSISVSQSDSKESVEKRLSKGGSSAFKWSDDWLKPFSLGWRREIVYRGVQTKTTKQCDIYYYAPDNVKLRSLPMILDYINRTNCDLGPECFSFSKQHLYKEPFETVRNAGQCTRSSTNTSASNSSTSIQLNNNEANNNNINNNKSTSKRKSTSKININDDDFDKKGIKVESDIKEEDNVGRKADDMDVSEEGKKKKLNKEQSTNQIQAKKSKKEMAKGIEVSDIQNVKNDVDVILKQTRNEVISDEAKADIKFESNEEKLNGLQNGQEDSDKRSRASRKRKTSENFVIGSTSTLRDKSSSRKLNADTDEVSKQNKKEDKQIDKDNIKRRSVGRPRKRPKSDDDDDNISSIDKVKLSSDSMEKLKTRRDSLNVDGERLERKSLDNEKPLENKNFKSIANDNNTHNSLQEDSVSTTTTTTQDNHLTENLNKSNIEIKMKPVSTETQNNHVPTSTTNLTNVSISSSRKSISTTVAPQDKPEVDSKVRAVRKAANLALKAYMDIAQKGGVTNTSGDCVVNSNNNNNMIIIESPGFIEVPEGAKKSPIDQPLKKRGRKKLSVDASPINIENNKINNHTDDDTKKNVNNTTKAKLSIGNKEEGKNDGDDNDHSISSAELKKDINDISIIKNNKEDKVKNINFNINVDKNIAKSLTAITNNNININNNTTNVNSKLKAPSYKRVDQTDKIKAPLDSNGLKNLVCGPSCAGRTMPPSVRCDICMSLYHPECLGVSFINAKNSLICWSCQTYVTENENAQYPMVKIEEESDKNKDVKVSEKCGDEPVLNDSTSELFEDAENDVDDSEKIETQVLVINPAITKSLNIEKEFILKVQGKSLKVQPENIYITSSGVNIKLFDNPLPPEYISGLNNPLKFLVGSSGGVQTLNVSLLNSTA